MNFQLKNSISNEELKEILKRAIQRTNKYNLSSDFEIKQLKSIIIERTIILPKETSLSKRIYAFLSDFKNCKCKICGTIHTNENGFCSRKCWMKNVTIELEKRTNENRIPDAVENGERKYRDKQEGYDYVVCQICSCKCGSLEGHLKIHNISGKEYKKKYNIKTLKSQRLIDGVSGENNPGYHHNGKFSAWSKNFVNGYDEEKHNQFKQNLSDRMTGADFDRSKNVFCKEYYETEEDYLAHQTKNLDFFVNKYGEEEGNRRWNAKRDKWLNTMSSKSDEEKSEINKKKIYKKGMISNLEREIVANIKNLGILIKHQFQIRNGIKWYVYDIQYKNKIIEINGDYWHANPEIYSYDSFISLMKMSSLEIWEKDRKKIDFATSQGYDILTIWEFDYKQNKQQVIEQCLHFLTQ